LEQKRTSHDNPVARRDVSDWLEEAKEELKTAEQLSNLHRYAHSCFHSQQAAEKAIKALIIQAKRFIHRSHDLVELHNEVKDTLQLEPTIADNLPELSTYYTQARYPNAGLRRPSTEIGKAQAQRSLETARGVVDAVVRIIASKI